MERFYWSLSSGSQFKTARILNYPYCLINFMSQTNNPPKHDLKSVWVDCGGFHSSLKEGHYTKTDQEYLEYIEKHQPEFFALRDYPCEPELMKKHNVNPRIQIQRTLENHLKLLDLLENYNIKSTPVPVLQGWILEDYLYSIDLYNEHNLIMPYMAIGSVCRRNKTKQIIKIITKVKEKLGDDIRLHGFGVKISALKNKACFDALWSVDSGAWDYEARWRKFRGELSVPDASLIVAQEHLEKYDKIVCRHNEQMVLI